MPPDNDLFLWVGVNFDGTFKTSPLRYEDGLSYPLAVRKDNLPKYDSLLELLLETTESTYIHQLFFKLPQCDLEVGLKFIENDRDLEAMFDYAHDHGKIELYVSHGPEELEAYYEENLCLYGSEDEQMSSRKHAKHAGNMTVDELVSWGEEEAGSVSVVNVVDKGTSLGDRVNVSIDKGKGIVENGKGVMVSDRNIGLVIRDNENPYFSDHDQRISDIGVEGNLLTESDSEHSDMSYDYVSEAEEELISLRKRQIESKIHPKIKTPFTRWFRPNRMNHASGSNVVLEHEEYMDNLMQQIRGPSDGLTDPFAILEMDEGHDKYPVYDEQTHWKMRKPKVGEKYASIEKLKECLTYYSLANGFSLWFYRSSTTELIARCGMRKERVKDVLKGKQRKHVKYPSGDRNEGSSCPFRCYGGKMNTEGSFQVISMVDEHKCVRNFRYGNLVNYKWIAKHFGDKIRQNPSIKMHEIADMVMKKYKCIVSPEQCKNAKCKAMNEGEQTIKEHYAMIRSYGKEILDCNIGSTVKLGVTVNPDDKTYFDRFYCCFNGLKKGFQLGCRPVIALDGCFLKKPFVGEILTAVGRDGNNHIFPIAWAVVNVENKDNWSWFLELLGEDIGMPNGSDLTLISDQHKGLIEAVKDVMPNAEHRQCARHIYEGFRKKYSGVEFRELFWAASKASYPQLFNKIMAKIKKANPGAHEYLIKKDPKTWSRAFFRIASNCDSVENGFSECFNSVLLHVKNKPLITMLESMRVIVMERLNTMRILMAKWPGNICPNIQKRLELNKDKQRFWHVIPAGGNLFEVRNGSEAFTVDEEKHTCTCRMWQLAGLPCPHSIAVIFKLNKHPEEYIPDCYRKESFYKAYHQYLSPIGGMSFWPDSSMYSTVLAPTPKRMPGRPRRLRRRDYHERQLGNRVSRAGTPKKCQNCYEQGHNKSTCQNPKVYPPPKEAPIKGRPRKNSNRNIEIGETSRPHVTPDLHGTNHEVNGSYHVAEDDNDYNFVNVRRPEPSVGRATAGSGLGLGIKRGVGAASTIVGRGRGGSSIGRTRGGSSIGLGIKRGVGAASAIVGRGRGGSSIGITRGGSSIGLGIKRGVGAASASVGGGRGRGRQNVGVKYGRLSQWFGLQDETCQHGQPNDNILTQQSQVGTNTLSQQLQVEVSPNSEGVASHTERPRSARLMQKRLSRTRTDGVGASSSKNHEY